MNTQCLVLHFVFHRFDTLTPFTIDGKQSKLCLPELAFGRMAVSIQKMLLHHYASDFENRNVYRIQWCN